MNERMTILLLFLAGLSFRLLHCLLFANDIIPGSDQMQEIMLGRKFASGDFYGVLDTYWAPVYPILIGIVSAFIDSPVIPAVIVSIIAGSLVVPLTYVLVRQSYGRPEATVASVIAVFFAHLINSVVMVGSENVYMVLILGFLIVAWKALRDNSIGLHLATGIILGLAYLTRPEAIGYPIYFVVVVLIYNFWLKRPFLRSSLPQAAALLLGFFLFATPYILYLRGETGRWTVSGKTEINALLAKVVDSPEMENVEPSSLQMPVRVFLKYFLLNLVEVNKIIPIMFPPLLFLLVGLGLFRYAWDAKRFEREFFSLFFCLVTVVGYAAAVAQLRYFLILLPILFGWTARGIVNFAKWIHDSTREQVGPRATTLLSPTSLVVLSITAVYLYLLPLNFYMRSTERSWEISGYEERNAGLWLKQNTKPDSLVFSASRRPIFYAETKQLAPATTDIGEILTAIKEQNVDYIVTSERSLKRNPFLRELPEIVKNDPGFERVYEYNETPGYQIVIYKSK
ncbi:MAG: hypothetical protein HOP17_01260 [Acidobacteria bacterium]|nr:hypothetical protein [Acidobacteriota bacterium]